VLVVTGANGNLGRRLLKDARVRGGGRALVRRESAVPPLKQDNADLDVRVVDYLDAGALTSALEGATSVVHLVGILKESSTSRYERAHQRTTEMLIESAARAGVGRILNLSIIGSDPNSNNACLRSKGATDAMLLEGAVDATVARVPMVLGEGDYAAASLHARASKPVNWLLRAESLEQPLYAGDVVTAVLRMLKDAAFSNRIVELAGPEVLSRAELTRRGAAVLGNQTRVRSLPLGIGMAVAAVLERLPDPPLTRAMLGVLDHDDDVDVSAVVAELGLKLMPLDEALRRCIG